MYLILNYIMKHDKAVKPFSKLKVYRLIVVNKVRRYDNR